MFRRFRAWLRVVLPAENALFGALILTLAPVLYAGIRSRLGADTDWEEGLPTLVPLLSAVIYGVFRAVYFNPMEHRAYGAWLSESPWQFPRPLPLGPLHLVWQDLFIVGLLTAIFPHDFLTRLNVPTIFLLAYCMTLTYSHTKLVVCQS